MIRFPARIAAAVVVLLVLAACGSTVAPRATGGRQGMDSPGMQGAGTAARATIVVHRAPDCSCCHLWEAYLREHGWDVISTEEVDISAFKARMGVPSDAASCHTAVVAGYVVEGHVPIAAIERLLSERPHVAGIGLPGMPAGSPGMDGVASGPMQVLTFDRGTTAPFGDF